MDPLSEWLECVGVTFDDTSSPASISPCKVKSFPGENISSNYGLDEVRKTLTFHDQTRSTSERPLISYTQLIYEALKDSKKNSLFLSEIYGLIERKYIYYRESDNGWKAGRVSDVNDSCKRRRYQWALREGADLSEVNGHSKRSHKRKFSLPKSPTRRNAEEKEDLVDLLASADLKPETKSKKSSRSDNSFSRSPSIDIPTTVCTVGVETDHMDKNLSQAAQVPNVDENKDYYPLPALPPIVVSEDGPSPAEQTLFGFSLHDDSLSSPPTCREERKGQYFVSLAWLDFF